jgi:hypothetical protein
MTFIQMPKGVEPYVITLRKQMRNRLKHSPDKQVQYVIERALKSNRGNGWKHQVVAMQVTPKVDGYYTISRLIKLETSSAKAENRWPTIWKYLKQAAQTQKGGKWTIIECPKAPLDMPSVIIDKTSGDLKDYSPIKIEVGNHFDHLFGLENHIKRTLSALKLAQQTGLQKRIHTVYIGLPGVGKTDLTLAIANMLGKENQAYLKYDATSTTQAGAISDLLNSSFIPPVLLLEEAEKTQESASRWLLGLLDKRGEVRQNNFRVGNRLRNVKMVCIATVNDEIAFRGTMAGALASRFANKIYFGRPSRAVMFKILEREVKSISGDLAWIEPTLKFCMDRLHWDDPREIIPICLMGQEDLLSGKYQDAVLATLPPESLKKLDK